jgi:hypothetical protein
MNIFGLTMCVWTDHVRLFYSPKSSNDILSLLLCFLNNHFENEASAGGTTGLMLYEGFVCFVSITYDRFLVCIVILLISSGATLINARSPKRSTATKICTNNGRKVVLF